MDIIFIIFLNFSGDRANSMQFFNYDRYLANNKIEKYIECNKMIKQIKFKKKIQNSLKANETMRVGCIRSSRLESMQGVFIKAKTWLNISKHQTIEVNTLFIPNVAKGFIMLPNEKLLSAWDVYSNRIRVTRSELKIIRSSNNTVEGRIISFFRDLENNKPNLERHFVARNKKVALDTIQVIKKAKKTYHQIDMLAKISIEDLRRFDSKSKVLLADKKILNKIKNRFGAFDFIVFIEMPSRPEDNFVLLRKVGGNYKIVAIFGWMYSPE